MIYDGCFENNEIDGYGTQYYFPEKVNRPDHIYDCLENVISYQGIFQNGLKNSIGILNFSNGDQFLGEFMNGLANGLGIYTENKTNEKIFGIWKDNLLTIKL